MKKNNLIGIVIALAILIFANLIASQLFFRVDMTENQIYSLSDVTKEIAKTLPDNVIVKAFFSGNIPAPYNDIERYTRDMLDEYHAYAGTKLEYVFIDPEEDESKQQEAMRYRIQPIQIQAIERDEMSLKRVFMGLVFIYEDKMEVIPAIQNVSNLEYQITSILKKLVQTEVPQVGFTAGNGEPELYSECRNIQNALAGQYSLTPVDPSNENGIPEDLKTLVVVKPKEQFTSTELANIDQFLMYGGKLAFFVNQFDIDFQTQASQPIETGITNMIEKYGLTIKKNLVVDTQCGQVGVTRNMGIFQMQTPVQYPPIPIVTNFNEDHLISSDLETCALMYASPIDNNGSNQKAKFTSLFSTSDKADVMSEPFDLNPLSFENAEYFSGPFDLAYAGEGIFPSYFGDHLPSHIESVRPFKAESEETKMVVVGNGDFIVDQFLQNPGNPNLTFFLNVIDWLTSEEGKGLISIRSREVTTRPLEKAMDMEHGTKVFIKYLNVLLAPIILIVYGLTRWQSRKRRRAISLNM